VGKGGEGKGQWGGKGRGEMRGDERKGGKGGRKEEGRYHPNKKVGYGTGVNY